MRKNEAGQVVAFQAVSSTDGSAVTTGSPTVYITIDGGTQATGTNTAIHEGQGAWSYVPTQAETNGDHIVFTFTLSGCINQSVNVYPVVVNDYKADVSSVATQASVDTIDGVVDAILADTNELQTNQGDWLTATGFSTFNPATDTVANVTTVGTCTTNTDMRGTDNALLAASAPTNWSIMLINGSGEITTSNPASGGGSAHTAEDVRDLILGGDKSTITMASNKVSNVALVDTTTTNTDMRGTDSANTVAPDNASISAILADTNELQTNQDNWLTADLTTVEATTADTNADLESFISDTTTNFNNMDTKITTVDTVVDAILVDTSELQSKLIPMLILDGSVYQWTINALENAPSGGGGGGDATAANQTTIINTLSDMSGATFDTSTDSLEAIRNRGDAAWVTGGGGGGIWQLTVTVTDTSTSAVQGARVAVDETALTVTTNTNGEAVLNLNDGSYTLNISAPSGYDDPAAQSVTISGADGTLDVVVSPTASSGCEVPPL